MVHVTDEAELKAWLEARTPEQRTAFAARCALRALPGLGAEPAERLGDLDLPTYRVILMSGVAAVESTPEVCDPAAAADTGAGDYVPSVYAAAAARFAVSAAAAVSSTAGVSAAAEAARRATITASSTSSVSDSAASSFAANSATSLDADVLDAGEAVVRVFDRPLWPDGSLPSGLSRVLEQLRVIWAAEPATWGFWARWYEGMLEGRPMDWDLQRSVALIPNEIWEAGPAAVAKEIARIELAHRTEVLPRLEFNEEDGLFHVEREALPPDEVADFVRQSIEIALKVALESGSANGFDETCPEAMEIRASLDAARPTASVLATRFYAACLSFQARIGDVYPKDTSLINLQNALWGATEELCELDDLARQRCARLAALEVQRDVDATDRSLAGDVPDVVGDLVDDDAREIIESDVERILSEVKPPKTVRARFTNWMTTLSNWMDRGMKADKRAKWLADLVERLRNWWGAPPDL